MKNILILLALSMVAITASAQEVTYIKKDKSFLEGREFLQEMNARTQDPIEAQKPKLKNTGAKEFSDHTQRMTMLMKRLNADQPLPSEEKLDADLTEGRSRSTDFLRKARIEMRLMNERTNPSTPATQPSGLGGKNAFGTR